MTRLFSRVLRVCALAALVLAAACKEASPLVITIPESDVQKRVDARFPVEKRKFLTDVTLQNPDVILTPGSDRVGIALDIVVKPPLLGPFTGKLAASGKLSYRPDQHAFFLLEPTVDRLVIDGVKEEYAEKAQAAAESIALTYLASHPVYELQARNLKEVTLQYALRDVTVSNGALRAVLGPPP